MDLADIQLDVWTQLMEEGGMKLDLRVYKGIIVSEKDLPALLYSTVLSSSNNQPLCTVEYIEISQSVPDP